ncbi:MAG: ABC transporter permease [Ignavibacteriaceae bacterium]|nr:ABC transporter permease [Ignavibacteriaceae bacterium]
MHQITKNKMLTLAKIIPLIIFIIIWEFLAKVIENGTFFFGSPSSVMQSIYPRIVNGTFFVNSAITFYEAFLGFIIGNIIGTTVGLLLWYFPIAAKISRPYIIALGSIPIFAVSPIVIIWFGIGITSKVILAALSTVVIATVQAFEGASQTNNKLLDQLYSMGADKYQTFKMVVIPSTVAWLFAGYKMNVAFALLGAFIGEFISSEKGLGHMIIMAMGLFNIPLVLGGVLGISLISIMLTTLIGWFQKLVIPWNNKIN